MGMLVNTNVDALKALQPLSDIDKTLASTQNRVSTGLRVTTANEDAVSYSVSQKVKSDAAGYEAIKIGLGLGGAALSTAIKAGEAINELLLVVKEKAEQAQGEALSLADRVELGGDVDKLLSQIGSIIKIATFTDVNLISSDSASLTILSDVSGQQKITISAYSLEVDALGLRGLDLTSSVHAAAALLNIENAISLVSSALSVFVSEAQELEAQNDFVQGQIDQMNSGHLPVANAGMVQESAGLQDIQTRQRSGNNYFKVRKNIPADVMFLFG